MEDNRTTGTPRQKAPTPPRTVVWTTNSSRTNNPFHLLETNDNNDEVVHTTKHPTPNWMAPPLPASVARIAPSHCITSAQRVTLRKLQFNDKSSPRVPSANCVTLPRVTAQPPRVDSLPTNPPTPIAHRTCSRLAQAEPSSLADFAGLCHALNHLDQGDALAVLDKETGKLLKHRQLCRDPKYKDIWDKSYTNKLGRLCQGIGTSTATGGKRVARTNTFFVIDYNNIPAAKRQEIVYTKVVWDIRPGKSDENRTRITVGGNLICYPGNVGTNTALLELVKLMINSVISCNGVKFACLDIKNFYLDTPMAEPEYAHIKMTNIPAEFIAEYSLEGRQDHNDWIYFEIRHGCYSLPQAGILANTQLCERLEEHGYYKAATTPGLWQHKWRPVQFCLIVDDFGVKYVDIVHFNHFHKTLKKSHEVTVNMKGDKIAGIDVQWDHPSRRVRINMRNYINDLLISLGWTKSKKPWLSPFTATPIVYGQITQLALEDNTSAPLPPDQLKRVQKIVGSLLYYAQAVDNKLQVALNAIRLRQAKATEHTESLVNDLLDYVAWHPNDGILYRASDMVLCAHADAGYLHETNARSQAGAHIFLSENDPIPGLNGAVLTIATIIKFVMTSASKAKLTALFLTACKMIPHPQTLIDMLWPQPPSPMQQLHGSRFHE